MSRLSASCGTRVWSWAPCVLLFVIAFGLIGGFIPPTGENWSAEYVAAFYDENRTGIRIGLIGAMFATALLLPFYMAISDEIRRIEGRRPLLAPIQFGAAVVLVTFFQIICLLWLLASFRPEADAQIIRAATDYGWLVWTILIPTISMQWLCMAIASFVDSATLPVWPRWAGYTFIMVSITNAGGICAVFFKTGPFSWNGLIGWWLPTVTYALVMTMSMWLMHKHETRAPTQSAARTEPTVELHPAAATAAAGGAERT